ncbi:DUF3493 domain-containing protein [Myxosarcina sp. GI1]|uniref:DUF3493 domain-containing protein n=1 Tax=Myxosarcina sp. GI1 TaxID=1541065 RepID=UPI0006916D41|nr:DUF3493 domain-containing protein [Myxosarcina sp. GI1]
MANLSPQDRERAKKSNLSPEKYARLQAEAKAPFKGLRKFFYLAFAASGFIGAMIFLAKLAAGKDVASNLPNFMLQLGLIGLMFLLYSWEQGKTD